jgi:hypothetical protein
VNRADRRRAGRRAPRSVNAFAATYARVNHHLDVVAKTRVDHVVQTETDDATVLRVPVSLGVRPTEEAIERVNRRLP